MPQTRPATLDHLRKLKPLERTVEVAVDDETTVVFRYRSIGRRALDELKRRHPPTDEQSAEYKAATGTDLAWNTETFPVALVAASAVEPEMTAADVDELFADETEAEFTRHFLAALEANTADRMVAQLGKASNGTGS